MSEKENIAERKSTLINRNIIVLGKRTSVRLERTLWKAIKEIADRERCTIHDICSLIKLRKKENTSLTAAIRVFIVFYYRMAATEEGHKKAGHGNFSIMMRRFRVEFKFPGNSMGNASFRSKPVLSSSDSGRAA